MRVIEKYRSTTETLVTVDVNPPRGADLSGLLSRLKGLTVDWLNVTDNSGANVKADSIITSYRLQEETGLDTIPHVSCRDTNRLGLQSRLLGAALLHVDNILALTGDRIKAEEKEKGIKGVFDITSVELIRLIHSLNAGIGYNGQRVEGATNLCIGATADPNVENVAAEARQLKKKLDAGAEFVLTQPLFSFPPARRLLGALTELYAASSEPLPDIPIFWGVIIPKDAEWAQRLAEGRIQIPGVEVPPPVVERLRKGGPEEPVAIIREVLQEFRENGVRCLYVIPIGRYDRVPAILNGLYSP